MSKKLVAEFIGAFFLVVAVSFTGNPIAIGLMLAVMVYVGGHISGAHYNPAVTLAFLLSKKLSPTETLGYWLAQILGTFCAACLCWNVTGKLFVPGPGEGVSTSSILLIETICTFALVIVVLTVATAKKLSGNHIYGLAIGLTLAAIASVGGAISGGVFNPAVAIGPMLHSVIAGAPNFANIGLYLAGPLLGGALARVVFDYLERE